MTEALPNQAENSSEIVSKLRDVLNDPEKYNLQGNVHDWPSGDTFDALPDQCHFSFDGGGKYFTVIRDGEKYLQLPNQTLDEQIGSHDDLTASGFERLSSATLSGMSMSAEDLADDLLEAR